MSLKFKIGALTDVGLVRTNNEDNFLIIPDLAAVASGSDSNAVYDLGRNGALMVVADGMGGMNAGEVASETAIASIKTSFSPVMITPEVLGSDLSVVNFMNKAIVAADAKIKAAAMRNPESQGMGTTIVLAWILGDKLYVSWCGDSRAYVFNSAGLHQITKDHSYVQSLVDEGQIKREEAFDNPQSNVITRSLCDAMGPAEPEALFRPYPLANGDTIILCTDGVSGMLRDSELEDVIGSSPDDLYSLMDNIKTAVKTAGASDNFTMCITQVVDGALPEPDAAYFKTTEALLNGSLQSPSGPSTPKSKGKMPWKLLAIIVFAAIAIAVGLTLIFSGKKSDNPPSSAEEAAETLIENTPAKPTKTEAVAAPSNPSKPAKTQPAKQDKEDTHVADIKTLQETNADSQTEEQPTDTKVSALDAISGGNKTTTNSQTTVVPPVPTKQPEQTPAPSQTPAPGQTDPAPQPQIPIQK